jgi:HAD superfamily hydrolase (TIGR01549 family)
MMDAAKAVLFDLDDTLFDHRHAARCSLQEWQVHNPALRNYSLEFLEKEDFRLLGEKHALVLAGSVSVEDARVQRVQSLFKCCGEEIGIERAKELAQVRMQIYRKSWRAVPGAAALLAQLKRHVRIGVVTNNFIGEQQNKIESCGLGPFIDILVTSEEAGYTKPSPEIFHIALERLACKPNEAVMIGDSWESDIVGAVNAGLPAVWLNRDGTRKPDTSEVLEILSLEPASAVVRQLTMFMRSHADRAP